MKNRRAHRIIVALLVLQSLVYLSIVPAMAEQSAASKAKPATAFLISTGDVLSGFFNLFGSNTPNDAANLQNNFWTEIEEESLRNAEFDARRQIFPTEYRVLQLNNNALRGLLDATPHENAIDAKNSPSEFSMPMPDGSFKRFRIVESPIMEDALAAQFSEIRTYLGQGIDDATATVRFDITPKGFHAQILSASGATYIDPYLKDDANFYIVYDKQNLSRGADEEFSCLVKTAEKTAQQATERELPILSELSHGATQRTYRLAVATTGEYTQFTGGTTQSAMTAIAITMNRVNGIYQKYFAVRMLLVGGNASLIYTDANTDPYTNTDGETMLAQNQATIDAVIGTNNYDIGHVFSTGGGGIASLQSPCNSSTKAQGVTGSSSPTGDPFDVDYVAHEIGHQFGGNHTFNSLHANGTGSSCTASTRSPATAFEPGSGSTIQAYAGICPPGDLQPNSDAYFHNVSLMEMTAFMNNAATGDACAVRDATNNNIPTVDGGSDFTIPPNTPFTLTAIGSDADGDTLTYTWEQSNAGPLFRSRPPSENPSRTFPSMQYVQNNNNAPPATYPCTIRGNSTNCLVGEQMPGTNGTMIFKVTAYDNRASGGAFTDDTVVVTVEGSPFSVTSPNGPPSGWSEGALRNVTWNVGGGSVANRVKISLSIDGGATYPFVLVERTDNDGAETIVVPEVGASGTTTARVKVEAVGNIFFDISDQNFEITDYPNFSVGGKVVDQNGGVEGIILTLQDDGGYVRTAKTNEYGDYIFNYVPANVNYTVVPSQEEAIFSPVSQTTGSLTANVTLPDFNTRHSKTYTWTQLSQVVAIQEGNPQNIQRNNDWNNSYNWSPLGIPNENDQIIVSGGQRTYYPPGGLDPIVYTPQGLSLYGVAHSVNGFTMNGNTMTGGILNLAGDIPGSSKLRGGLLDVVMNVSAGASFDWEGGTFNSAATVAENGYFIISSGGERIISRDGVLINNAGEMRWSDSPTIQMTNPCFSCGTFNFTVNNTGTIRFQGTETLKSGDRADIVFNNFGTLIKTSSSPTGATNFSTNGNGRAYLNNYGTVNVSTGILKFTGGGGTLTVKNGSSFVGGGLALVDGGELVLPFEETPTSTLDGTLEFRSGNVEGSGTFNGSGIFNWTGGTIGFLHGTPVPDAAVTFGSNTTVNISGDVDKHLGAYPSNCGPCHRQSGRLTFNGTTNWTGTGKIFVDTSGASGITNNGTFNIRNDSQMYGNYDWINFTNNGTLRKENSSGTTTFGGGARFNNSGTIDNQSSGTIEFTQDLNLNAGSLFKGTNIKAKGATRIYSLVTIGDSAAAGTFELAAGTLAGQYISGTPVSFINGGNAASRFIWTGGEIVETVNLGVDLTTNVTGAANKDIGHFDYYNGSPGGALNNAGTINLDGGSVRFGFQYSTLTNNGTINISGDVNFVGNYYTPLVTNTGTINKIAPLGAAIFDGGVNIVNSGTLNAQVGLIEFNRDLYLDTGTLIKGGGVVRTNGYTRPRGTTIIGDASGGGKFQFAAGTIEGQTLNGEPNSFINSGNAASEFSWTGGRIFYTLNLGAGLTTNITGAGYRDIGNYDYYNGSPWGVLNNAGTLNWYPGADIRFAYHSAALNNSGTFNLYGNNTIHGNYYGGSVNNTGTIEKINTDGATTIAGNLGFSNTGTIKLSLDAATNTNRLNVGVATLGGTLNVKFINGFNPADSDLMPVISYSSRGGSFSSITTQNLVSGRSLSTRYNPNNLTVRAYTPTAPVADTPVPENWFKADAIAGANNSTIATWADSSGKLNNATMPEASRQPKLITNAMNGNPVVRFDGANDQLQFDRTIESDFTMTAVFQSKRGAGGSTSWYDASGLVDMEVGGYDQGDFGLSLNVNGRLIAGTGSGYPDTSIFSNPLYNDGRPHIATFTRKRTTGERKLYVDGNLVASDTAGANRYLNSSSRITLGSLQTDIYYLNGDIAEVLVYGSVLSDTDRQTINNYLTTKYVSNTPKTVWDAAADFLPNQNGVNGWSYGYLESGVFNLYADRVANEAGANIDRWHNASIGTDPSVRGNLTGTLVDYYGTVRQAADELSVHPNVNRPSVVRWTAPETAAYLVQGRFDGNDYSRGTTSDVKLNHNQNTLLAAPLNGFGTTIPLSRIVSVAQGDTIDFVVGPGANNNPDYDITGLAATIIKAPMSISGRVTKASGGAALGGVTVNLKQNGAIVATATTDAGGGYAFVSNLAAGANYIIEPAVEDFSFSPATAALNNFGGNQIADFAATQIAFFANGDFNIGADNNPNGAWSYGWSNSRGAAFNLMNTSGSDATHDYWSQSNVVGVHFARGKFGQDGNKIRTHSGEGGQNSVLRWTAPTAGTYRAFGYFEGGDYNGPQTNVDVAVLQNSLTMTSGNVIGGGKTFPFDVTLTVAAGETIDFTIGRGVDGWYGYDTTFFEATVRPVSVSATANSIAGTLTDSDGVTPVSGAVVSLFKDGKLSNGAITNANGQYSFANLATNGNYIVSAAKTAMTFKPSSRSFPNLSGTKTADFTTGTFTAPTAQCAASPSNLVSWYRGGDNADDQTGGNHGTLESGVTYVDGKAGRAFDFNGTGGVALGNPANLKVTDKLTVAAWIKPRPMGDNTFGTVVGKWNNVRADDSYLLFLYKRPGGLIEIASAIGRPQDDEAGLYANLVSTGATIQPNEWAHVAMTYDQTSGVNVIYVNGIEVGRRIKTGGINANDTPVFIGRRNAGGSTIPFNGAIDEATIFNRALSAAEIRSLVDADNAGQCVALSANTSPGTGVLAATDYGSVNFTNVNSGGTTTFTPINPAANQPILPSGYSFGSGLPAYEVTTTATFEGTLTICFSVPSVNDATTFSRLRVMHGENGQWVDRTSSHDFANRTICAQTTSLSPFAIVNQLAPTTATVSVSGRVIISRSRGFGGAILTLTEADGSVHETTSDQLGRFSFENINGGQIVTIGVRARRLRFNEPTQILTLTEDVTGVTFTIQGNSGLIAP